MTMQFKTYEMNVKQDAAPEARRMTFTISTGDVDRDGDMIDPKGWDTTSYMKNPCVLFAHDYSSLPVAKAIQIETTDTSLIATAEFPKKGVYPFADTVYELLKGGFLNATSVGFKPLESQPIKGGSGNHHTKQSLLEWSIVPIPANPHALVMQRQATVSPEYLDHVKPLVDWSEKFLGEYYGERGVWLPASQIEKTFEAITKSGVLMRTKSDIAAKEADGSTSTGEKEHEECKPKEVTIEFADDAVLELTDDLVEVELADVQAGLRSALTKTVADAMTQQLNYMRGRVV